MTQTEEFLNTVIKMLVDEPDKVVITRTVDDMGVLYTLSLSSEDMGKVIGKRGQTAKAIRTLLRIVGMKYNERANLKINEPDGGYQDSAMASNSDDDIDVNAAIDELKADL